MGSMEKKRLLPAVTAIFVATLAVLSSAEDPPRLEGIRTEPGEKDILSVKKFLQTLGEPDMKKAKKVLSEAKKNPHAQRQEKNTEEFFSAKPDSRTPSETDASPADGRAGLFYFFSFSMPRETPALDDSVENPVSAAGAEISRGLRREETDETIRRLAETGKLVFFFRSDCPFCGAQAEVLATLEKRHGVGVVAASLDAKGLPPLYPDFADGSAQAARLGVDAVPAVFLFVPSRRKIARIGTGFLTLGEIRERLRLVGEEIFGPPRTPAGAVELLSAKESGR